jgi:DNA-binding transcriptional ArsR family regulator
VSPLDRTTQVFAALASVTRCRIISLLLKRAQPAGVLTEALDLRQSNVSNHLALLREAGLVITERHGRRVVYRLSERDALLIAAVWKQLDLHSDAVIGADGWRADSVG